MTSRALILLGLDGKAGGEREEKVLPVISLWLAFLYVNTGLDTLIFLNFNRIRHCCGQFLSKLCFRPILENFHFSEQII